MGRACSQNGGREECFRNSTGTPGGNSPLGWPTHRWEDKIRMYLKEIGINTRKWLDSAKDRDFLRVFVNSALNLRVPQTMVLDC